jgi:deoxyguanosine kinase
MSQRDIRYIAIEGVIGVGKSTLARLLGQRMNARTLLEEVEENPFLHEFYEDRERYAFQTQMHFLFSRFQQQRELMQTDLFVERVVSDYLFQKDKIFANLNLSDRELALYEIIVRHLEMEIPRPDVVVYLQANTDTLLRRIRSRGRPFEKEMSRDYLKDLNDAYNTFFFHYTDAPLLVVSTDSIDFVRNSEDLEDLSTRILSHREGTVYYSPMGRPKPKRRTRKKSDDPAPEVKRQETTA